MKALVQKSFLSPVILCAMLFACGSDELTGPASLTEARNHWNQRGPSSYAITITRSCECLDEMSGPVDVVVQNDTVVSRTYSGTHQPVAGGYAALFPSIDGLFEMLDKTVRDGNRTLTVEYDPKFGFPVRIGDNSGYPDSPVTFVRNFRSNN